MGRLAALEDLSIPTLHILWALQLEEEIIELFFIVSVTCTIARATGQTVSNNLFGGERLKHSPVFQKHEICRRHSLPVSISTLFFIRTTYFEGQDQTSVLTEVDTKYFFFIL